jgi:DNA replication protein DnaC
MLKALEEQLHDSAVYEELSFQDRLGLLIDREQTDQDNRRLATRLRSARFRQSACLEDLDFSGKRGLDKGLIKKLATGQWINDRLNILITGPCGAGKSYIAEALAHKGCVLGHAAFNVRAPGMFNDLAMAKGDGQYKKLMRLLTRTQILVIDDWGLTTLTDAQRHDLLEIIDARHNTSSTIVTSQLPVKHWHDAIGNATLADAILDRLVHNAYIIELGLDGDSMRKANGKKRIQ